jgi:hypothetical protein
MRSITYCLLVFSLIYSGKLVKAQVNDPFIQAQVARVNQDSITKLLQAFEAFGKKTPGSIALSQTGNWIRSYYQRLGYTDIRRDSFQYINHTLYNLVITLPGTKYPDKFLIVDAHYDTHNGPGTNDNGTGTAILMEMARILTDLKTEYSIKFIHFSAEEEGLIGSSHYVDNVAIPTGMDIKLVFNIDEVGGVNGEMNNTLTCERDESPPQANNEVSWAYTDTLANLVQMYTNLQTTISYAYGSDYVPFQEKGYTITGFYETNESPYVHSPSDVLAHLDLGYVHQVGAASMAALCYFSQAYDEGSGVGQPDTDETLYFGPNPFTDYLKLSGRNIATFALVNLQGITLKHGICPNTEAITIDTQHLPAGAYFLKLTSKNEQQNLVYKVIKSM